MSRVQARRGGKSNVSGQHNFARIPTQSLPRSVFKRSCGLKTTFDSGLLIPIFLDEALPGDTMNMKTATFTRMATPLHPVMDNMHLDIFYFAVPLRLLWENFEKFMGAQANPDDTTDYLVPQVNGRVGGFPIGSIEDYFGIPVEVQGQTVNAWWHRAYNLIWNEWFRDENLQDSVIVNVDDGPDNPNDCELLRRGKRHDYFSSALPWPQKGDPVLLPLGVSAPILDNDMSITTSGAPTFDVGTFTGPMYSNPSTGSQPVIYKNNDGSATDDPMVWSDSKLDAVHDGTPYADLSAATAVTINQLREAVQVQKLYERDARGGTRYTEIVRSHFGVTSPDARLQRPEYLGGGHSVIQVNPVPQTTSDTGQLGDLGAFVTSVGQNFAFKKSFTEHCVIIGLANVRADLNYQQGLNKMFFRSTRFDFYWSAFAGLGEQAILNKEIYSQTQTGGGEHPENLLTFGYQERYAEYRYKPSQITGQFRSDASLSLDTWHLAQDFGALPLLNADFIEDNPPVSRVVAVPSEPEFLFDAWFDYTCVRPMPVYGVPGGMDRF